jgi:hypothetical protein
LVILKPQQCQAHTAEVQPPADGTAGASDEDAQQDERRNSHAHASTSNSSSEQQQELPQRFKAGRSIYTWPRLRNISDRPAFLNDYPPKQEGQGGFNINSFLGKREPYAGKFYVPPDKYRKFLSQYTEVGLTRPNLQQLCT